VQQIHCVDDERAVTGILTDCITELLDGLDRMFEQHCAPAMQVCCREVAIYALDTGDAERRDLGENVADHGSGRIVGIDEDREAQSIVRHLIQPSAVSDGLHSSSPIIKQSIPAGSRARHGICSKSPNA
jgi:hypothetical protein